MDIQTANTFVNDNEYQWVTLNGNRYYVRPDAEEEDWITHLLIHEDSDVNQWSYAITSRVVETDEYDNPVRLEAFDILQPEETA